MTMQINEVNLENLKNYIDSKKKGEFNIYELMKDVYNELDPKKDIIIIRFKKANHIEILAGNNYRCGTCDCCTNLFLSDDVIKDDIEIYKISLDIDFSE